MEKHDVLLLYYLSVAAVDINKYAKFPVVHDLLNTKKFRPNRVSLYWFQTVPPFCGYETAAQFGWHNAVTRQVLFFEGCLRYVPTSSEFWALISALLLLGAVSHRCLMALILKWLTDALSIAFLSCVY